jgi:hypothetical protein|tara:strand:+ start:1796 stop:2929 length:1134 start_codon:yes stop_codon:yes gene_type:complete
MSDIKYKTTCQNSNQDLDHHFAGFSRTIELGKGDHREIKFNTDLKSIEGVEIFETGNHNGDKYTQEDLIHIERNFSELKDTLKPYVKLGHNEDQTLLAKDGMPSAGWIDKIYVKGTKLFADIVDVPKTIYELIKNKAYKRVSSEIYWNLKNSNGKIYKRALKAIALLGGDTPAVGTLADIQALYKRDSQKIDDTELRVYEIDIHNDVQKEGVLMPTVEELQARLDESNRVKSELEKTKDQLEKQFKNEKETRESLEAKQKDLEKNYSKLQKEAKDKEIVGKVDTLINDKKILPAQKGLVAELFKLQDAIKTYSKDDEIDTVTKFFESCPDIIDTKEHTKDAQPKNDDEKMEAIAQAVKDAKDYSSARMAYASSQEKS